jgi:type III secretion protein Q
MLDATVSRPKGSAAGSEPEWGEAITRLDLPEVPVSYISAFNAFYRRRPSLQLKLAGRAMRIAPTWLAEEPEIGEAYTVTMKVDGDEAALVIPASLLTLIMTELDPNLSLAQLDPEQTAFLMEFALSDALDVLERAAGCQLSIVTVSQGAGRWTGPDRPSLPLVLYLERLGVAWALLRLSAGDVMRFANILDKTAGLSREPVNLPVPFRVRVASVVMTLGELRSLRPGDIVLVDDIVRQSEGGVAVIGEHIVAPVEITPGGYRFGARLRRGRGSSWEWSLNAPTAPQARTEEGGLEAIAVRVMFERGSLELDLNEVQRLMPGAILPLARGADEGLDITVNGRSIGRGRLTRIGDAAGVRITRLFGASA